MANDPSTGPGPTLADPRLEAELVRSGFAVVEVPAEVLASLDELWAQMRPTELAGFHATTQTNDPATKPRIHDEVCRRVAPAFDRWFVGHRPIAGNFVVKQPGEFWVQPHQDLNFVDEATHRAVVVWVPLQDTDERTGTLHAVPGSHRLPTVPRGSGEHTFPWAGAAEHLRDHRSVAISLRRGQALAYDARTFHWSGPNDGDRERVAVAFAAIPDDSPVIHCHLNPDGTVAVLETDDRIYADTRFHGFPVRGRIVRVDDLEQLGPFGPEDADAALAASGAVVPGLEPSVRA